MAEIKATKRSPSRKRVPNPMNIGTKPFITSNAHLFLRGYFRGIDSSDVLGLILAYSRSGIYFIKGNRNIHNENNTHSMSMYAVKNDMTLRDLAIHIEDDTFNKNFQPRKVHFWLRFSKLKCIYPSHKMNISIQQIEDHQYGKVNDRWVEIPNDLEDICIDDFNQMMMRSTKDNELELGVEIYDEINQKWPFRNDKFVPIKQVVEVDDD